MYNMAVTCMNTIGENTVLNLIIINQQQNLLWIFIFLLWWWIKKIKHIPDDTLWLELFVATTLVD